jgi:hypothetical protein
MRSIAEICEMLRASPATMGFGGAYAANCHDAADRLESLSKPPSPLSRPAESVICAGCGTTKTDADIAKLKAENPLVLSCCPERKPLNILEWFVRCTAAEERERKVQARLAEAADLLREHLLDLDMDSAARHASRTEAFLDRVPSSREPGCFTQDEYHHMRKCMANERERAEDRAKVAEAKLDKALDLMDDLLGLVKGSGEAALEFVQRCDADVGQVTK